MATIEVPVENWNQDIAEENTAQKPESEEHIKRE